MTEDKQKETLKGCAVMLVLLIIGYFGCKSCGSGDSDPTPYIPTRAEKIQSQFSAWDGAHKELKEAVKLIMNDPGSFEHASSRYVDHQTYLTVTMVYRGKNAFGGVVPGVIVADVDLDGNIIKIISSD